MHSLRFIRIVILAALLAPSRLLAGVVDSPLPAPFTQHVFTVPGVVAAGGLATYFSCTNLDAVAVTVGVELFSSLGGDPVNDAAATSLSVSPGATVRFGTAPTPAGLTIDKNIGITSDRGSARVLSTSRKIACTAFAAEVNNAPPTVAWQLTIISKLKQKAFN
jgi:hypothetical protein